MGPLWPLGKLWTQPAARNWPLPARRIRVSTDSDTGSCWDWGHPGEAGAPGCVEGADPAGEGGQSREGGSMGRWLASLGRTCAPA